MTFWCKKNWGGALNCTPNTSCLINCQILVIVKKETECHNKNRKGWHILIGCLGRASPWRRSCLNREHKDDSDSSESVLQKQLEQISWGRGQIMPDIEASIRCLTYLLSARRACLEGFKQGHQLIWRMFIFDMGEERKRGHSDREIMVIGTQG